MILGRVRFTWAGVELVAELTEDLEWSCPENPDVARWLGVVFDPKANLSPANGSPGIAVFREAAGWLEAEIEYLTEPKDKPNDIY